ncbi:death on curing protein [Enterococcus durans]|uniref:Death on curing protein n=1 Tax=Enterococcus durans TaxID=53345 RepID=A0A367CDL7_9ENTE|nr:type II toxin-antitoxin system death-on-curing family toxin [Enterococcus durans]RCA10594.1 death on curing protein [Enterococcus durans]
MFKCKILLHYSKGEPIGVKDSSPLDMTINQLSQSVFGEDLYPSIYDKASILAINLAKKHPFYNGNKRTALLAMVTFLEINGYTTAFSQNEAVRFILAITTSKKEFDILKKILQSI